MCVCVCVCESYILLADTLANVPNCTASCRRSFMCINKCDKRVHFLGVFAKLRKATISFVMPVHLSLPVLPSAWNTTTPTGHIFMKIDILAFFGNLSKKSIFVKI